MAKLNIVFDMTKYDLFQLCKARFNFRHNLNIAKPGKSEPLERGSISHVGAEVYYQALKDKIPYDKAVNMALSKIRQVGAVSTDLDMEVVDRVVDVMEEYFDYWQVADQGFTIDEVEQPFMFELYSTDEVRLFLAGKIDLVVSDNKYEHEPYDHKTYDRTYNVGRMSNQFKCYATATKSNYVTVNKIGFQKTLKPHEKFVRTKLTFDALYLEEWKKNVINVLMNEYLMCVSDNVWPMNETSCDKFNRKCEFYEICDSSGLPAKNFKINNEYISIEPWDVTRVMSKSSQQMEDEAKKREKADAEETNEPRTQTEET